MFRLNVFTSPLYNIFFPNSYFNNYSETGQLGYVASPYYFRNFKDEQVSKGTRLFQALYLARITRYKYSKGSIAALCKMEQIYVEPNIICNQDVSRSRECSVIAQHLSQVAHAPSAIAPFSSRHLQRPLNTLFGSFLFHPTREDFRYVCVISK